MKFLQQMPPAHILKSCLFFWKGFLRTRHLSSDVFFTFSLILGREERQFYKADIFLLVSFAFFPFLKTHHLYYLLIFFNSHLNCGKSKFTGFSQDKWLTISRDYWSDKFCLSLTWSNSKMKALFKWDKATYRIISRSSSSRRHWDKATYRIISRSSSSSSRRHMLL